jgi:hypothetical protein
MLFSVLMMPAVLITAALDVRADHRDATRELGDPRTNLSDVYAFVNPNNTVNVVLAMTVNGFTVPGVNPVFAPDCLYQFKIDNTGDFVEDLVIQIVFDPPAGPAFSPTQNFTVVGPIKAPRKGAVNVRARTRDLPITGPITSLGNTFTSTAEGIRVFCGVRDEPFFFDEIKILRGPAAPPGPPPIRTPGVDYYAGLNCSAIAIELPVELLTGTLTNLAGHKQLNVWATTSLPTNVVRSLRAPRRGEPVEGREVAAKAFVQHDRAALPGVSTFLIAEEDKNAFCGGQPKDDGRFFAGPARVLIQNFQLNPTDPAAIAAADHLLAIGFPDVLRLDVTSTTGFATDNGRRPTDDVISYELGLLTAGALLSQNLPANDVPSLSNFPFFAPPHTPAAGVPPRN